MTDYYNPEHAYGSLLRWEQETIIELVALEDWKQPHPDWQSEWYEYDWETYKAGIGIVDVFQPSGKSTFDPDDPMPNAHGKILTTETFLSLVTLTLHNYLKAGE